MICTLRLAERMAPNLSSVVLSRVPTRFSDDWQAR